MKDLDLENFNISLAISVLLHFILILVFFFGLPSFIERLPEEDIVTFEMLPISAISNVKNQDTKKAEEVKTPQESQKVKRKTHKEEVEKPVVEKVKEEVSKKPVVEKPKEAPAKKEVVVIPKKEVAKPNKITPKKLVTQEEDTMDAIIKNLMDSSEGESEKVKNKSTSIYSEAKHYARSTSYNEASPLSNTEEHTIRQQIQKNFQPFPGINTEGIMVNVKVNLAKDGKIIDSTLIKTICPNTIDTAVCNMVEQAAFRALKKTNTIVNLDPERYSYWKELSLGLKPTDL